jgi:DNA excision repair protein ERCC-2
MSKILFPHESLRPIQEDMVHLIAKELTEEHNLVVHAPTGLGKTAASMSATLSHALDKGKTIFFLTSKNTQHRIAVETLQEITKRHNIPIKAADIVGKKWMCLQPGVSVLPTGEFNEYCRALREDKRCEFYENLKQGESLTPFAKYALAQLEEQSPTFVEETIRICKEHKVCPYEIALLLAAKAHVIIADYYYVFHSRIRETFFKKNKKELENAIIIVDEAHNLPARIKDLATTNLSLVLLKRAAGEAKKQNLENIQLVLEKFAKLLRDLGSNVSDERHVSRDEFLLSAEKIITLQPFIEELHDVADKVREEQKVSSLGAVADFLEEWSGGDEGFTRILTKKKSYTQENIILSYRCLDPSLIAKDVVLQAHTTILMSGTLTPTAMYKEVLGFPPSTIEETFPSPFPEKNQLNLIIAKTSTKYTTRSEEQYQDIAKVLTDVINEVPGNIAVFFPSYQMKERIDAYLIKIEKTVLHEHQEMNKTEKEDVLKSFRRYKLTGACLLAVVGGSFSEGIDLPGEELQGVVVVGLPLGRPDLETKALIDYYDRKFNKGWDYGYVFPAFNKVIQSAGRCIRSASDKGVIIFLDERFTWPQYYRCFPSTWKMKVSVNHYQEQIAKFFAK